MCTLGFSYTITEFVPPPPAVLTIHSITVEGDLHAYKEQQQQPSTKQQPRKRSAAAGGSGSGGGSSGSGGAGGSGAGGNGSGGSGGSDGSVHKQTNLFGVGATGPCVRFILLEVEPAAVVRTPAAAAGSQQPWAQASLKLRLPEGSPRPPLVRVQLWDETSKVRERGRRSGLQIKLSEISLAQRGRTAIVHSH